MEGETKRERSEGERRGAAEALVAAAWVGQVGREEKGPPKSLGGSTWRIQGGF